MRSIRIRHAEFGGDEHYADFFEDRTYRRTWDDNAGRWRLSDANVLEWREYGSHVWDSNQSKERSDVVDYITEKLVEWVASMHFHDALESHLDSDPKLIQGD